MIAASAVSQSGGLVMSQMRYVSVWGPGTVPTHTYAAPVETSSWIVVLVDETVDSLTCLALGELIQASLSPTLGFRGEQIPDRSTRGSTRGALDASREGEDTQRVREALYDRMSAVCSHHGDL